MPLWDQYREWLLRRVGFVRRNYDRLMIELHNSPFEWVIERDKNRARDGMVLREEFFDSIDFPGGNFDRECSVLEMLVGLSIRIDDEYIGNPADPHPEKIFWEMICNLDLQINNDRNFDGNQVFAVIRTWVLREFRPDGKGSIFPLKSDIQSDIRHVEIWTQMQEYLNENY